MELKKEDVKWYTSLFENKPLVLFLLFSVGLNIVLLYNWDKRDDRAEDKLNKCETDLRGTRQALIIQTNFYSERERSFYEDTKQKLERETERVKTLEAKLNEYERKHDR